MQVSSLKKYVKVHDIPGVSPLASKEDLLMAVNRHFMGEVRLFIPLQMLCQKVNAAKANNPEITVLM